MIEGVFKWSVRNFSTERENKLQWIQQHTVNQFTDEGLEQSKIESPVNGSINGALFGP